jgi:hypothetical protein
MATASAKQASSLCAILDPRGQPTAVIQPHPLAPRLDAIQGKSIYMIDVGFGGGWEFLEEAVAWFSRNQPGVKTVLQHKKGIMFLDEPEMWAEIKQNADAVILGVGG